MPARNVRSVARRVVPTAIFGIAIALSTPLRADITVLPGNEMSLAPGTVDAACTDVIVGGILHTGTTLLVNVRNFVIQPGGVIDGVESNLEVGGDWTNDGTFVAGHGSVAFVDACAAGPSTISGETTFHEVGFVTSIGKTWRLQAGATQTIRGTFGAKGAIGTLTISSTVPGQDAFVRPRSLVDLFETDLVFVRLLVGNNAQPVPGIGALGVALLGILIAFTTLFRMRRRR